MSLSALFPRTRNRCRGSALVRKRGWHEAHVVSLPRADASHPGEASKDGDLGDNGSIDSTGAGGSGRPGVTQKTGRAAVKRRELSERKQGAPVR